MSGKAKRLSSGEPVWLLWFRTRSIPSDWEARCCVCGKQGKPLGAGLTAFAEMVMIDFLNNGMNGAKAQLRGGAYSFLGSVLVPFHPVLEDGKEARDVVTFFGNKELRACTECMVEMGALSMKKKGGGGEDDDEWAW